MSAALLLAHDEPWDHGRLFALAVPTMSTAEMIVEAMYRLGPGPHWVADIIRTAGICPRRESLTMQPLLERRVVVAVLYTGRLTYTPSKFARRRYQLVALPYRDRCATMTEHAETPDGSQEETPFP